MTIATGLRRCHEPAVVARSRRPRLGTQPRCDRTPPGSHRRGQPPGRNRRIGWEQRQVVHQHDSSPGRPPTHLFQQPVKSRLEPVQALRRQAIGLLRLPPSARERRQRPHQAPHHQSPDIPDIVSAARQRHQIRVRRNSLDLRRSRSLLTIQQLRRRRSRKGHIPQLITRPLREQRRIVARRPPGSPGTTRSPLPHPGPGRERTAERHIKTRHTGTTSHPTTTGQGVRHRRPTT
jgi:hypothetical protein